MRARAHAEEQRGGRTAIVISELPYGVKKGGDEGVIAKMAELVKSGVLSEISRLRDSSDKSGMRIVVELKRDAIPQVVLNKLFKHTALQSTFGYNAVALVDGVPKTLSLLELLRHYLEFQRTVIVRRSKFELRKAEERAHVLEGYLVALDNLDAVIALIRAAEDTDAARTGLMEKFDLSEIQAQAILDLRLRALTALERKRVETEHADLRERIAELRTILGDEARVMALIREELLELKQIYGKNDDRRTEIMHAEGELDLEDLIAEEDMVIAITRSGYIKRLPVTAYREQRRGGKGVMGMDMKEDDYIEHLFVASTHDYLLFFTTGRQGLPPEGARAAARLAAVEGPRRGEPAPVPTGRADPRRCPDPRLQRVEFLVFATKKGMVKKTKLAEYNTNLKADGIIAINLKDGRRARRSPPRLARRRHPDGLALRAGDPLQREGARPMGRATAGVQGMRLRKDDEVIAISVAQDDDDLLVVTEQGYGKRTPCASTRARAAAASA
jgi:DNA gyrase subunit A